MGTPRIYNFILLLVEWVCSFSTMLPSVKFVDNKVLVFFILRKKRLKLCNFKSNPNCNPDFQGRLIRYIRVVLSDSTLL